MHGTKRVLQLVSLLLVLAPSVARAEPDDEASALEQPNMADAQPSPLNLGVLLGYGLAVGPDTLTTQTTLNPYSVGFGIQADYQLSSGIVLGLGLDQFLGESKTLANVQQPELHKDVSARYLLVHGRIGYNISMQAFGSRIDVRPSLWVGLAAGFVPPDPQRLNGLVTSFLVAPGLSIHYAVGTGGFYLGEDIRLSLPFGDATRRGILVLLTAGTHV